MIAKNNGVCLCAYSHVFLIFSGVLSVSGSVSWYNLYCQGRKNERQLTNENYRFCGGWKKSTNENEAKYQKGSGLMVANVSPWYFALGLLEISRKKKCQFLNNWTWWHCVNSTCLLKFGNYTLPVTVPRMCTNIL